MAERLHSGRLYDGSQCLHPAGLGPLDLEYVPRQRERHYAQRDSGHDISQRDPRLGNGDGLVESPKTMIRL